MKRNYQFTDGKRFMTYRWDNGKVAPKNVQRNWKSLTASKWDLPEEKITMRVFDQQ